LPRGSCQRWLLAWRRFVPRRQPLEGLDDLLLDQNRPRDFEAPTGVDESVQRVLCSDLARRWVVGDVARALGKSSRTLQRELAAEGTSFTRVLEQERVSQAARLLREPERSVTEIGYVCGFADTAHFSRRFKACMGVSPSAFRNSQVEA
jgi:AraC-like DNA-binding protein